MTIKLNFQLDFRSDVPIYEQIAEELRKKIAEGQVAPGDQLPTVRQLATGSARQFQHGQPGLSRAG